MNGQCARTLLMAAVMMIGVAPLTGCSSTRLKEERNALWRQNEEAQNEIDRLRMALDASEAQSERLQQELGGLQGPAVVLDFGMPTDKFAGIEGVETFRGPGSITVRIPGDVLFASGKVDLKSGAKQTLGQIAAVIQREYPGYQVRVEGYTDSDPIRRSKWADNLELSLHRAAAVHRFLQKWGISAERMYAAGFGQSHSQATKAKSRRVEIAVVMQE